MDEEPDPLFEAPEPVLAGPDEVWVDDDELAEDEEDSDFEDESLVAGVLVDSEAPFSLSLLLPSPFVPSPFLDPLDPGPPAESAARLSVR